MSKRPAIRSFRAERLQKMQIKRYNPIHTQRAAYSPADPILKLASTFEAATSATYSGPEIAKAIRQALNQDMCK